MASFLLFRKQIPAVEGRTRPMAGIQKAALSGRMHQLPAAEPEGPHWDHRAPLPAWCPPPGRVPIPRRLGSVSKVSVCWVTHLQVSTLGTCALKAQHISLLVAQALLRWLCAIAKVTPDPHHGWACASCKEKKQSAAATGDCVQRCGRVQAASPGVSLPEGWIEWVYLTSKYMLLEAALMWLGVYTAIWL